MNLSFIPFTFGSGIWRIFFFLKLLNLRLRNVISTKEQGPFSKVLKIPKYQKKIEKKSKNEFFNILKTFQKSFLPLFRKSSFIFDKYFWKKILKKFI